MAIVNYREQRERMRAVETKKGGSKGLIFVWIYLVCIGFFWLFWLGKVDFVIEEQDISRDLYRSGMEFLASADTAFADYKSADDKIKTQYHAGYEGLKSHLIALKRNNIDHLPLGGLLISIVAFLTGMAYILTGIKIFKRSHSALKFLKWGIIGFFLHYVLLIFSVCQRLLPLNTKIINIFLVFEPQARYSLFGEWLVPMIGFGVFNLAIGYILYVLLPRLFLSRPNIKAQLK